MEALALGLLVGLLMSLTGAGGGILAVIALGSMGGVAAAAWRGAIAWNIALPFAAGAVAASLLARVIATRVAAPRLQQGFAIVSAGVALLMAARGLGWLAM